MSENTSIKKSEVIQFQERPPEEQIFMPMPKTPYEVIQERVKLDVSKMIERALKPEEEEKDEFDEIVKLYMKLAKIKLILNLPNFLLEVFGGSSKDDILAPITAELNKKVKERISKIVVEDILNKKEEDKTLEQELKEALKPAVKYLKLQMERITNPADFKQGKSKIIVTDEPKAVTANA